MDCSAQSLTVSQHALKKGGKKLKRGHCVFVIIFLLLDKPLLWLFERPDRSKIKTKKKM